MTPNADMGCLNLVSGECQEPCHPDYCKEHTLTQNADSRALITVRVLVASGTDLEALALRLFGFLGSDPDDLFPEITEIEDYEVSPKDRSET